MTRRGYVAGALVALVLLVVPLGLVPYVLASLQGAETLPGRDDRPVAGDPKVAAAMTCADRAVPASEVPIDVVAARMCATDNGLARWYAPQDSLHADLAPLIELLGSLEPLPESTDEDRYYCTDDGGVGFDLRLALASGEVVSVPGDTGGCSTVRIGDQDVVGSDEVVATFLDRIAAQRASSGPADVVAELPLGCESDTAFSDHVLSRTGDPADLVRAVSCSMPDSGGWGDVVPITSRQVAILMADLAQGTRKDQGFANLPCGKDDFYNQDIVGQTSSGDVVALRGACGVFLVTDASSTAAADEEYWYPSPEAQRILDRLRR
jgi:hypothetical protein